MTITTINLSALNGTDGFRPEGVLAGDRAGYSVSDAGDINGDGFADLIVGAPNAYVDSSSRGASYVVFGSRSPSGFAPSLDFSTLNGTNGFRLEGAYTGDRAGTSVSAAGDVNGDGFDDLIVGAPTPTCTRATLARLTWCSGRPRVLRQASISRRSAAARASGSKVCSRTTMLRLRKLGRGRERGRI